MDENTSPTPTPADNTSPFGKLDSRLITRIISGVIGLGLLYTGYNTFSKNDQVDTWNGVLYCHNTAVEDLDRAISQYYDTTNFDEPKKTTYQGLSQANTWNMCTTKLDEAMQKGNQKPELNATLKDFKDSAQKVVDKLSAIAPYYKNKEYLTDQYAKGKAADAEIETAVKQYTVTSSKFTEAVDQAENVQRQEDISEAAKDPQRKNEALLLQVMDLAKKTMESMHVEAPNKTTVSTQIQSLQTNLDLFKNTALTEMKSGPNQSKYQAWKSWSDKASKFLDAAKAFNNLAPTSKEDDQLESLYQTEETYNNMIDQYNSSNTPNNHPLNASAE
jgi:hypothetical protein